jgi:F-type H+-transporting ATPase subunit b
MQTLDIISVNLWQILISLFNLFLLFLIIKKFLYEPVKKVMAQRQAQIDADYADAARDKQAAAADRKDLEAQLAGARERVEAMLADATLQADHRGEKILQEAKQRADGIIRRAEADAAQEMKKAEATIKKEIVDVSYALTEKMLEREINEQDHRTLIDDFIDKLGEDDDK